ncbi:MAG: diaminopimelate epimerase [Actinomycetota bacterium]|nr:diaminopimelate epimerase [Actinomycetota bacterium]
MQLTKHHGLGNDFLICLTREEPDGISELASQICDRRTGIGADGLIVGLPGSNGADLSMVLHNSDGSFAEMSGNGIRCLAQAYAMANNTGPVSLEIDTAGGRRSVAIDGDGRTAQITVGMGTVGPGPGVHDEIANDLGDSLSGTADLGNPHLVVVVDDHSAMDMTDLGIRYEAFYPDGINIEWISVSGKDSNNIDMVVWERGVGASQACGTGATAAAVLAHQWGLVDREVQVQMPGGVVQVLVGEEPILIGPVEYVGAIEISV